MAGFSYNYKPMDYNTAQKQALGQLDPLYQQGIKSIQQQQYQNNLQSGNVAAARGLGHSGLAADQLNKIAIASQGQIGDLNAQRMTQAATMATDLVNQDKQYDLQRRSTLFNEYASNRDYNYGVGRDKVADNQWNQQFNYTKSKDTRDYNYQVGRDKVADAWKQKEWSQMSPAEKQQMALQYSYSQKLKGASGGGGGGGGRGRGGRGRGGRGGSGGSGGVVGKNTALQMDPRILEQYLKAEQQRHNHDATVDWGTQAYYNKMDNRVGQY